MGSGASQPKVETFFDKFDKKEKAIDASRSRLRDMQRIGRFTFLQKLVLRDNILSTLPDEFTNLKFLKELDLSLNRFLEIPPVLFAMKNIAILNMDGNIISRVPRDIREAEGLEVLSFEYNKLEDLPLALFLMPQVKRVKIRGNKLSTLPKDLHLRLVYKLIDGIYLTDNNFTTIPPEVLGQQGATELFMDKNQLSHIPKEIAKLSKLRRIELAHNNITTTPPELFTMPDLKYISLGHNQIEEIPSSIGRALKLEMLILRDNKLKTLPDDMKNLRKLKILDLAQNSMEEFPLVVTELERLDTLNMTANHLRFLPPDLSKLIHLKKLGLGDNVLNHDAFEVLLTMIKLQWLFLENNLINVISPEVTERLKTLKQLSLDGNPIEDIPEELLKIDLNNRRHHRNAVKANGEGEGEEEIVESSAVDQSKIFGGQKTFTISPNEEREEQIAISNTFALELPPDSVTSEMKFEVAYADEEEESQIDLPLKEGEQQESELIDITPRSMSFGSLVSLVVKLDAFDDPSRDLVIMQSEDNKTWNELKTYREGSLTKVKVKSLTGLVAVTKPHVDEMNLGEDGGKLESTAVDGVSVSFPGGAVAAEQSIAMEVDPMRNNTADDKDALCEVEKDVSLSPCVFIKGANGKKHLEFSEEVNVTLPIPPPLPGKKEDSTELRVLKDEKDNNTWKDITDDLGPIVRHARRASFGIRSFSGYVIARTDPLKRNRISSFASRVRRSGKGSRKHNAYKVKVMLLQLGLNPKQMVISIVVADRLREKRREFVKIGYSSSAVSYSGDFMLKRGENIEFDVDEEFEFTNENRKCVFYPNRDNTTHVHVIPKDENDNTQKHKIGFIKFFKKDRSMVAELPFKIFLITPHDRRLSRMITDPDMVFETDEDYEFFFSFLAGTLLIPHQQLTDFAMKIGLQPEEFTKFRNMDLRQQVYRMLILWKKKEDENSENADMKSIVTALRENKLENHASTVQRFRLSDPNTDIRGAMRHVSSNITPSDMKIFARYLGLKEIEIETIKHDFPNDAQEQNYQMLLLWVRRAGHDATIKKLIETMFRIPQLKLLSDDLVRDFGSFADA
ncbi:uncharacterized protein [Ptychodera flava]|uniref:uncharacterized protein n=1 Tax=Ptychodera flava TaxID=63121 RepID=UPI00396A31CA